MAGLTTRGNKWVITTRNAQGKPTKIATGCDLTDRAGAERKLAEFEEEQRLGKIDPYRQHRRKLLLSHVDEYYEYQIATGITQKQCSEVKGRIIRLIEAMGATKIEDLSESRIQTAVSKLRLVPRTKKKQQKDQPLVSPRTRNTYRKSILSFLNWLYKDNRVEKVPLRRLKLESEATDVRHARINLTDDEFKLLYETAMASPKTIEGMDGRSRARAYLLSVTTGLRRNELGSLTRSSFDTGADPLVTVQAAFSKHRKTDRVKIPTYVMADLRDWIQSLAPDEYLFPRLGHRATHKIIKRDLTAAGISYTDDQGRYRDWHALRHSFVSRTWKSGACPNVIQRAARHQDLRTTMKYSHTTDDDLRDAAELTPRLPIDLS